MILARPLAAAALALVGSSASAQKSLGEWYRNQEFGFKVRVMDKWKQIPLQPDERFAITKFNGPEVEINVPGGRAVGNPEFLILRFVPMSASPTTGDPDRDKAVERREAEAPRTFEEWLRKESGYSGIKKKGAEPKKVKIGRLEAVEHDFTHSGRYSDYHGLAFDLPLEGQNIVLLFDLPEAHYPKWESVFRQSARSFTLTPKGPTTEVGKGVTGREGEENVEAQRQRHEKDVKKVPGWNLEETSHYFIKIHNPDEDFIKLVKEHVEAIRARLEADFPPVKPITVKSVLRVCLNKDEYHRYGGPAGSAGYWNDGTEELVIYDDKERQRSDSFRTMYHEAFHQYIFYRCGKIDPHSWYNEGTGDYYAGASYRYGKLEIKAFQWRTDIIRQAKQNR